MAYRFIEETHAVFGLRWLLKKMDIYPNAYYNPLCYEGCSGQCEGI